MLTGTRTQKTNVQKVSNSIVVFLLLKRRGTRGGLVFYKFLPSHNQIHDRDALKLTKSKNTKVKDDAVLTSTSLIQ
jgi:hypothetical protein